jgi:dihydrofolate reductase
MKEVSMIVAVGNNWELGLNNRLLCHLPEDMKWFKLKTSGHTVIMGDRTWESLPQKPLPNRRNIVMTLDRSLVYPDCEMAYSIEELLDMLDDNENPFIIGGATIYKLFIDKIQHLYLTRILSDFEADVFFPTVDFSKWDLISDEFFANDERNPYDLRFQYYQLKNKR